MPYTNDDGIQIYYEIEGTGLPVLLHHNLMGSHKSWHEYGYVDALKDHYKLIMITDQIVDPGRRLAI